MQKLAKTLIIIIILGVCAYFAANYLENLHKKELEQALQNERTQLDRKVADLQEKIADLEEEIAKQAPPPVPQEKITEVFGEPGPTPLPEREEIGCDVLEKRMVAFFDYIDKQSYMAPYELQQSTYDLFKQAVTELSEKLPLVAGEMKDPMTLMRNVAHFYRVLGEKRIGMFITVLQNESEILETAMANFFAWFDVCDRCEQTQPPCPSLEVMYQHAGFFLNTLAGRSYLLRRTSPIRILTTYYSVLILDKANDQLINPHGIDIRPYIHNLLYDMENQKHFADQKRYVERLQTLKAKYRM